MKTEELGPSLLQALARVPFPRSRHGRRHPLPAVLALATVAMLWRARSLYAIGPMGPRTTVQGGAGLRLWVAADAGRGDILAALPVTAGNVVKGELPLSA